MSSNINQIKNITSLTELAKHDTEIRHHAKSFIRCKQTADDIVNDMYISICKILSEGDRNINGGYIHMTLNNLYTNHLKFYVNRRDFGTMTYEAYIPESEEDFDDILSDKMADEKLYDIIDEMIADLTWYEQKILEFEKTMSLLELSKRTGISYRSLIYTRQKIRIKLGEPRRQHRDGADYQKTNKK